MSDVAKSKKNNKPIGVFDSGVGGLSVLIELRKLLPNENFVFLADQLHVPYGEKSKKELIQLAYKITDYFIKNHDVKMMVAACNTSTCSSIDEVRKKYTLPIVGTVPAIKPVAESTKTKTVGIISTPSTSQSKALENLIKNYCQNINVINIGCKNLENVVEEGEISGKKVEKLLIKYLKEIQNSNADHLVLGCTHYPFLKNIIKSVMNRSIKLVDGNKAIAKQVNRLLQNHQMKNNQKKRGKVIFVTTGNPSKFSRIASKLLKIQVRGRGVAI